MISIKNLKLSIKKLIFNLKYRYKYRILYKARLKAEKIILSRIKYIKNKGLIPNRASTPWRLKPATVKIISALILFPFIFLLILFFSRPDYNGKYIEEFSKGDKVCKLLLEDIEDFKDRNNGKGGGGVGPELQVVLYKIKKGESIWSVSQRTGLSMDTLISMNLQKNIHILQPGQDIHIPNKEGIAYKVQDGDTLESLAEEFTVDKQDIIEVNDLHESSIEEGMDVFIPNGKYKLEARINILGRFLHPLKGRGRQTSWFGWRKNPFTKKRSFHSGVDLATVYGGRIYAAESGKVIFRGTRGGFGKLIILKHSGMYSTWYGHMLGTGHTRQRYFRDLGLCAWELGRKSRYLVLYRGQV